MEFLLKKVVSLLILPLPIGLMLITTGLVFLYIKKAKYTQYTCILAGLCCIIFFSIRANAFFLINMLQSQYQPLIKPPGQIKTIVVLGSSISGGKSLPPSITLRSASLSRLVEGIRQFHLLEKKGIHPRLILSGGRVFQSQSTAGVMRNTAVTLGIHLKDIVLEDGSKDTHNEATYLKKLVGSKPFILVTSAYHMPRAMQLFRAAGTHPIPAPTQFFGPTNLQIKSYIPSSLGLEISDIAIHEYLGILWAKLNHQTSKVKVSR